MLCSFYEKKLDWVRQRDRKLEQKKEAVHAAHKQKSECSPPALHHTEGGTHTYPWGRRRRTHTRRRAVRWGGTH